MAVYSTTLSVPNDIDIADQLHSLYLSAGPSYSMLELTNASFVVERGWLLREPNLEYIDREIEWYETQSRFIYAMRNEPPAIWKSVADINGYINSNYGWCVFSPDNGSQFKHCLKELQRDPDTRRAVMYYTRPTMHTDQHTNGMNDHMCTFAVQYFIRTHDGDDPRLDAHVYMRSNDAVFGYSNDVAWQKHVHTHLSQSLNIPKGKLYWNAASLHVYPRHYYLLEPQR